MKKAIVTLGLLACLAIESSAASIKRRDGSIVTGRIQGKVLLRGVSVEQGVVGYDVISGASITSINESGVHLSPGSTSILVAFEQSPPKDDLGNLSFAKLFLSSIDAGTHMVATHSTLGKMAVGINASRILSDTLLGEYIESKDDPGVKITPGLRVATPRGVVQVPVDSIVEFRRDPTPRRGAPR